MRTILNYSLKFLLFLHTLFMLLEPVQAQDSLSNTSISIHWVNSLPGDFSFRNQWSYPEGIYRNQFGQLCCDGLCPDGTSHMRNAAGMIYQAYLKKYYQLIDTTHQFYSIQSESNCYEFGQVYFIKAVHDKASNITKCHTLTNVSSHSSLNIEILPLGCKASIELNSIKAATGKQTFHCTSGQIKIDKVAWQAGVLKAAFSFQFYNHLDVQTPLFWKGKIFTNID
ncbi:hypothetical protein BKI52_33340 [marine bacterium AO1-C]|nr:hypothetical protein BKI52_33340 [marine bacterium AO1-C]